MGRELTRRHASAFQYGLRNPLGFARDVYQYGKAAELSSFLFWETCHRLGLFRGGSYLRFGPAAPFRLDGQGVSPASSGALPDTLRARGLSLSRCPHNWKALFITNRGEHFGCLYPEDDTLYRSADGEAVQTLSRFPQPIKSLFVSSRGTIFVCAGGVMYRSSDGGASFGRCFDFSSTESFFRHNNAMTETPQGALVVGEYGNVWEGSAWRPIAYLYLSTDDGASWHTSDFLIRQGANKHVHLVQYSRALNALLVADGDNRKRLWMTRASTPAELDQRASWTLVNRFHVQMGGYTSVADGGDGAVLFGTDYQGGTNFVVRTTDGRSFEKGVVPDPYRRSPIDNMVRRRSRTGIEVWANLPYSTSRTLGLLMYTSDGGRSWERLIEYSRSTHKVWLLNASTDPVGELYLSVEDSRNGDRVVYRIAG